MLNFANVLEIKNKHPHSPNITFPVPSLLIQNPEALKNKIKRTLVNVLEQKNETTYHLPDSQFQESRS
jgi:hypothetical protein